MRTLAGISQLLTSQSSAGHAAQRRALELAQRARPARGPFAEAVGHYRKALAEAAGTATLRCEQLQSRQVAALQSLEAITATARALSATCSGARRTEEAQCAALADAARSKAQQTLDKVSAPPPAGLPMPRELKDGSNPDGRQKGLQSSPFDTPFSTTRTMLTPTVAARRASPTGCAARAPTPSVPVPHAEVSQDGPSQGIAQVRTIMQEASQDGSGQGAAQVRAIIQDFERQSAGHAQGTSQHSGAQRSHSVPHVSRTAQLTHQPRGSTWQQLQQPQQTRLLPLQWQGPGYVELAVPTVKQDPTSQSLREVSPPAPSLPMATVQISGVDLNGDGVPDVLQSGEPIFHGALVSRAPASWRSQGSPMVIQSRIVQSGGSAPNKSLLSSSKPTVLSVLSPSPPKRCSSGGGGPARSSSTGALASGCAAQPRHVEPSTSLAPMAAQQQQLQWPGQ